MFIKGDPASVNTLAGAFDSLLGALSRDTTDLSRTVTTLTAPDGWNSAASRAFADAWQRDADTSAKLGAMVSGGRDALRKLGRELGDIVTEANGLIASAEHQGFAIDDDGTVRFTKFGPTPQVVQAAPVDGADQQHRGPRQGRLPGDPVRAPDRVREREGRPARLAVHLTTAVTSH